MTQELTVIEPSVTPEQIALIKNTIAKGATDDELKLFIRHCTRHGSHPLDKDFHFQKRGGIPVFITSIDFMRKRAESTGQRAGHDAVFNGEPKTNNFTCTVTVKRILSNGDYGLFTGTARWYEYYPGDGPEGFMWRKMPHNMLEKCAEALALRRAFPGLIQGLYTREEMDQSSKPEKVGLGERLEQRLEAITHDTAST